MTETLQDRVSRLFSPKPWGHKQPATKSGLAFISYDQRCVKCKGVYDARNPSDCPIPDPIDITDLGKALECFRGLKIIPFSVMAAVYNRNANDPKKATCLNVMHWILKEATPAQIWTMCCDAKEGE